MMTKQIPAAADDDLISARFRLTDKELKRIRNAFERMDPAAHRWRRENRDDCEYFGPLQDAFYRFRDGWCAAIAHVTEEMRQVADDRRIYGSGFAMHTTGSVERISPDKITIRLPGEP